MSNIKLKNHYWEASGVFDKDQNKTQRELNEVITASLDGKAPVIYDTASGSVASFPDGADGLPLVSLTAQIEPVQDLHGYSKPWPGGGGKNLFPPYDGNSYGLTATKNNDGTMTINGTFTLSVNRVIPTPFNVTLPAGTYTLSGFGSDAANNYGWYRAQVIDWQLEITTPEGQATFDSSTGVLNFTNYPDNDY